jgi:hypothetical protein
MWIVSGLMALPGEVSRTVTVPGAAPTATGLNVTTMEQDSPGATVSGQFSVTWNGPVKFIVLMMYGVLVVLVSVTVC